MDIKKMILSGGMLVFVAAVVVGGTGAFFSDTETASDNVFTAGSISLDLASVGHAYQQDENATDPTGFIYHSGAGNFDFTDLKPLDYGTIDFSLVNGTNEAKVCGLVDADPAQVATDPNAALYDLLNFYLSNNGTQVTPGTWFDLGTVQPGDSLVNAVDYCFGQADLSGGTLSGCNHGGEDYNPAQGGEFSADLVFYAIQTRNNDGFECSQLDYDDGVVTNDNSNL